MLTFHFDTMKKIIAIFPFIILYLNALPQSPLYQISGKVTNAITGESLQGASVFAQNTTIGTATDASGNFTLKLPNGGYDLVVTFTGFETMTKRISSSDAEDKNIVLSLKQKEKAMEDVVVKASNEVKDGWEKYGDFFLENFLGKTNNSKLCTIKNTEVLKFYFYKKRNRLKVLATAPVEIENAALGYKIKYSLDSFTHEYGTQGSTYTGYPLFEEIPPANDEQRNTWQAKRLQAYKGSILHFMRSVYNKSLKQEGFEIQFVAKNNESETAIPLLNFYGALNYTKDDSTQLVEVMPNQPDVAILFNGEEPETGYLLQNSEAPGKWQLSVINIPSGQAVDIEQNGYYFDQNDIIINGYWTWEKAGDMLPYDYRPASAVSEGGF